MSETDKVITAISEVVVEKIDELATTLRGEIAEHGTTLRGEIAEHGTTLRGEIAELRAEMTERFDHLAKAVDVVAVRIAQLTNGDNRKK